MNFFENIGNIADMVSDLTSGDENNNLDVDLTSMDLDGDGIEESVMQSFDNDGDGIEDSWKVESDLDGDGTVDMTSTVAAFDSDGDGEQDSWLVESDLDGDLVADESTVMTDEEFYKNEEWLSENNEFQDMAVGNNNFNIAGEDRGTPVDLDGDGVNEAIYQESDTDGDGKIDTAAIEADMDGDGAIDSGVIIKDLDGDGVADQTSYLQVNDSDGDGVADTWAIQTDLNGDGVVDESMTVADGDGDGMADTRLGSGTGYNPWTGNTHDTSEYSGYNTYYVNQYGEVSGSNNWEDPYHYYYDDAGNTYYQLQ